MRAQRLLLLPALLAVPAARPAGGALLLYTKMTLIAHLRASRRAHCHRVRPRHFLCSRRAHTRPCQATEARSSTWCPTHSRSSRRLAASRGTSTSMSRRAPPAASTTATSRGARPLRAVRAGCAAVSRVAKPTATGVRSALRDMCGAHTRGKQPSGGVELPPPPPEEPPPLIAEASGVELEAHRRRGLGRRRRVAEAPPPRSTVEQHSGSTCTRTQPSVAGTAAMRAR